MSLGDVRVDLADEQAALDALLRNLTEEDWSRATPSPGWTVADQVGHLTYFDERATTAILDPDGFQSSLLELVAGVTAEGMDAYTLRDARERDADAALAAWREGRRGLLEASATLHDGARVPWYGPSMSANSFLGARLMETWAHGRDVAAALGTTTPATNRLRHVARLGFLTRSWSYAVRGESPPEGQVRVELTAPDGTPWRWGDEHAEDVIRGGAEEFCLVVTRRRHVADTTLESGALGRHWLERAQAFAGDASDGPFERSSA